MIISRTPLRISFAGGGTDMASFYRDHGGAVLSTSIDKYVYLTVNRKFDNRIRVSYSKTEEVDGVAQVEHPLVRAVMRKIGIKGGVEITSVADIPSHGSGLGSSSAFTVGLLNALQAHQGRYTARSTLAQEACDVEINICREPIGKQDQFAAALGGLNFIRFNPDETVEVEPLTHLRRDVLHLQRSLLMFYTGTTRSASAILKEQKAAAESDSRVVSRLKRTLALTETLRAELQRGNVDATGDILHEAWQLKRTFAPGVTNAAIDDWYARARTAGAMGGKILGAGGGGFLLFYAPPDRHEAIAASLTDLRRIEVRFETLGSTIIFCDPRDEDPASRHTQNSNPDQPP